MEKEVILKVDNISKQYRLGQVGTGTISHDLNRWWHKIRGKEDPYLKIGEINDRSLNSTSDYVWALKDISFSVKRGEVLGIIGKNGAGKSTLLKILSKVAAPTTGSVGFNGRIASLLEVGTGFHPELTGRENVFLNGAILGMTRKEIKSKISDIIEFSGCQRYIDTPVKRYSSGMTVRLAFAVAAFLEPEILIIDEVLAVGDAEFQKKALGKMQDISKGEGRTVLFVSHNMAAVKSLCTRAIVLEHGLMKYDGSVDEALNVYANEIYGNRSVVKTDVNTKRIGSGKIQFAEVGIKNQDGVSTQQYVIGDDVNFNIKLRNLAGEQRSELAIQVRTTDDLPLFHMMARDSGFILEHSNPEEEYVVSMKDVRLYPGTYNVTVISANTTGHEVHDEIENVLSFTITDGGSYTHRNLPRQIGLFFMNPDWTKII